jgi:hypothetical protein
MMNDNLIAISTALDAISKIIYNLSELYHHAGILSYLEDMETVGYEDGKDTPKELQLGFSYIESHTQAIQEQVLFLADFFHLQDQNLSKNLVLDAITSIVFLKMWTTSHERWINHVIEMDNELMGSVDYLRNSILNFIFQVKTEMQKVIPISFQMLDDKNLTFDDIKRNPQATIQHAFALLETQVRNKINASSDLFGEALINAAFGNNGCLIYGETPAEQMGIRNFVSGAYATFRNPRMHRKIEDNEHEALQLLAMVDLIMVIVEKARIK